MKKLLFVLTALALTVSSCKTVYSTTSIEANKSFVLGENEHGGFEVRLKNISKNDVELYKMPDGEIKQLIKTINPGKSFTIKIGVNTALYIFNKSDNKASVELNLISG